MNTYKGKHKLFSRILIDKQSVKTFVYLKNSTVVSTTTECGNTEVVAEPP